VSGVFAFAGSNWHEVLQIGETELRKFVHATLDAVAGLLIYAERY
jgi:hypothetical protein